MKGQLTIEYLASFIIFVILISYIYLSYSANIPLYVEEVRKETARSNAYQLSEILVNDPGEPPNWNQSTNNNELKRIGLSDRNSNKANLIYFNKTEKLRDDFDCANEAEYKQLQQKLALNKQFSIAISRILNNGNREILYVCNPPTPIITAINITVVRIVAINDTRTDPKGELKPGEVIVQM
jgi:hypothetical protein